MAIGLILSGRWAGDSSSRNGWTSSSLLDLARRAEEREVAFVSLPDGIPGAEGTAWPDAGLLASWLVASTDRLSFLVATSTIGMEPYNLARRIASIDVIGGGRTGWLLTAENELAEAEAFSGGHRIPGGNSAERIAEFAAVVRGLWKSWDADALLFDREAGRFLDPAKMHRLDHQGCHFTVAGPLNVMRSPQGAPILAADAEVAAALAAAGVISDLVLGDGAGLPAQAKRLRLVDAGPEVPHIRATDDLALRVSSPADAGGLLDGLGVASAAAGPSCGPSRLRARLGLTDGAKA